MTTRVQKLFKEFSLWLIPAALLLFFLDEVTNFGDLAIQQAFIWYVTVTSLIQTGEPIFLAIILESLPFILAGAIISSLIHEWVTEERLARWLPTNPVLAVLTAGMLGFVLPVCDCGTIPVARSLLAKKVPAGAVTTFALAAPTVNPITLLATFFAFGMTIRMALLRLVFSFAIACLVGLATTKVARSRLKDPELSLTEVPVIKSVSGEPQAPGRTNSIGTWARLRSVCDHTIHELFEIIGFLLISAVVAAGFQIYHATNPSIVDMHSGMIGVAIMMGLAIIFSLCSEADAFVARSFMSTFSPGAVLAFMLIGQMVDARNIMLLPRTFGRRIALPVMILCVALTFTVGVFV